MKKRISAVKIAVILIVLAALGAGGWYGWKYYKNRGAAKTSADEDTVKIARGDVELSFQDTGEVAAKDIVDINSKASGRITELFVQEGQHVKAGDNLAVVQAGRSEAERYVPTTLTSPIDGLVMRCVDNSENYSGKDSTFARVGQRPSGTYDSSNPTCIMQIADMRQMVVNMKIGEMDILKLHEGMPVNISVDAMPGQSFAGKIAVIAPQAETSREGSKLFRVQIALASANKALRIGMTARVQAILDQRKNVIKLPLAALFEEFGKSFVYKKTADNKIEKHTVKLGLRSDTDAEVLDGIAEGDSLYTVKPVENVIDKTQQDGKGAAKPAAPAKK
jgi:HlyD family secretion protein